MLKAKTSRRPYPWGQWLLIGLVVIYLAGLILLPLGALIIGAFADGLSSLLQALNEPDVLASFWLTIMIALITVLIHGVLGTISAWVLVRHRFPGRQLLYNLLDLPFAVSSVIAGYVIILIFGRTGWLTPLTDSLGIKVAFAVPGMVIATLFITLPFMVRELIPVLESLNVDQEQAAATLGASSWQQFRFVTFPLLRMGFLYGLSLTFARALGEFGAVLVVSGGIQGRTETTTLYIYRAMDDRQYVGAYTAALVLGVCSCLLVIGTELLQHRKK